MLKRIFAATLALLCLVGILPAVHATDLVPCMTVDDQLLFIGDSQTVCLQGYNADLGPARFYARSSARVDECVELWSSSHANGYDKCIYQLLSELSGEDFRTVVINIGINNIGWSMSKFRSDYGKLLQNLLAKNPQAVIYVCMILPTNPEYCNSAFNPESIGQINALAADAQAEYAALGYDVRILDLNSPFADSSGNLLAEYDNGGGIHMNAKGYRKLNQVIQTALAQGDPDANHSWGEARTLQAPGCGVTGLREYTCTVCGAVKEEEIPSLGDHVWNSGSLIREPTCTSAGEKRLTCKVCKAEKTAAVPALGHAWKLTETLSEPGNGDLHGGTARYACSRCGKTKDARLCAGEIFKDMPKEGNWAHAPIDWAWSCGVTGGTSANTFSPKGSCTRAQVVTFLWAAQGRPEAEAAELPFTDVKPSAYYYKALLWAYSEKITGGTSATTFGPKKNCTRAQVATFLWAANGRPEPEAAELPFTDVKTGAYYYKAVVWAWTNGVTDGTSATTFGPKKNCTRAQVVAFLYKSKDLTSPEPEPSSAR